MFAFICLQNPPTSRYDCRRQFGMLLRLCLLLAVYVQLAACSHHGGLQPTQQPENLQDHYRQLSQAWLMELKERGVLYHDPRAEQIIHPVMQRLLPRSSRLGINIHLAHLPGENAIALPDGTLVIHQSMLAALATEEQLAFLLAHEISHHLLNHAWYSAQYYGGQTSLAGSFTSTGLPTSGAFDRAQEQQADNYAIKLMARAGYDVDKAAGFFKQLQQYPVQFAGTSELRTHPSLLQRQSNLLRASQGYSGVSSGNRLSINPQHYRRFRLGQLIYSIERKVVEADLPGALVQLAELERIQGRTAQSDCLRADVYRSISSDLITAASAFSEITGRTAHPSDRSRAQHYFNQRANSVLRDGLLRTPDAACIRQRM